LHLNHNAIFCFFLKNAIGMPNVGESRVRRTEQQRTMEIFDHERCAASIIGSPKLAYPKSIK